MARARAGGYYRSTSLESDTGSARNSLSEFDSDSELDAVSSNVSAREPSPASASPVSTSPPVAKLLMGSNGPEKDAPAADEKHLPLHKPSSPVSPASAVLSRLKRASFSTPVLERLDMDMDRAEHRAGSRAIALR